MVNFKLGPVQIVTEPEFKKLWCAIWHDYPGIEHMTKVQWLRFETYYAVHMQVINNYTIQLTDASYQH